MTQGGDGDRSVQEGQPWWSRRGPSGEAQRAPSAPSPNEASATLSRMLWSGARLGAGIVEATPDCIEVLDGEGHLRFANPAAAETLYGAGMVPGEAGRWSDLWPAEARMAILASLSVARSGIASRFFLKRPTAQGDSRDWDVVLTRMTDERGALRGFLAVSRDATALRRIGADQDLRRRELNHRLKNVFALVNGLIGSSARSLPAVQPFAKALRDRFTALDRAHALPEDGPGRTLGALLGALLAPYGDPDGGARIVVDSVGDGPVGYTAATSLTLVVHELATNAVRHGALAGEAGHVRVTCRRDGAAMQLAWIERGGPAVAGAPAAPGFGSALVQRSVTGQLGGTIAQEWEPEGLSVRIAIPLDCLAR